LQFVDLERAAGKSRGSKVFFDKISNISTAGGTLVETDTNPKRNFTITQGTLTITEWGNAIPFTLKLQTLADITVPENIKTVLRNDMAKVLDSAAAAEFKTSDYKATIVNTATTTFGTAGVATATASGSLSDKNVRDIVDQMKKLFIPTVDGDNYVAIHSTNSIRGLYDYFEAKAVQTTMKPLFMGEVGTYYKCRHIEETNVLVNTLGSGSIGGEAVFFGADAVREGIAIPEEIRIDIPKDFGRDQGIAWYGLLGFTITWDYSTDGETRIIHVTSL
jgi:N4-gp56 family major capsid protein